nr:hypothetical protein [Tanacetum cinerariifolium]GFB03698.1 hypothetical protein [Tanacetum cinerariifolium]
MNRSIWELTFPVRVSHAHCAALPVNEHIPCQNEDVLDTIMSDSEDSTVTYTTVSNPYEGRSGDVSPGVDGPLVILEDSYAYVVATFQALPLPDYVPSPEEPEQAPPSPVYIPYVPEPMYPEYIPSEDDVFPAEEQPLPAAASPTTESLGYIPESDPDEDLEEDPANYPADHDDDEEEEPSGDDADEEDEEPQLPTLSFTKDDAERFLAILNPPPSPVTLLSSLLPQIPSPLLPASPPILPIPLPAASPPLQLLSSDRRADRPEVTLPPQKGLSIVHCPGYEAVTELAAVQEQDTQDIYRVMEDTQEARCSREAWAHSIGLSSAVHFQLQGYMTHTWLQDQRIDAQDTLIVTLTTQLSSLQGHLATALGEIRALQAREQAHAGAPEGASSSTYIILLADGIDLLFWLAILYGSFSSD